MGRSRDALLLCPRKIFRVLARIRRRIDIRSFVLVDPVNVRMGRTLRWLAHILAPFDGINRRAREGLPKKNTKT